MGKVTEALRNECAAEWDHLLHKTFSTPMAVEHLAQFTLAHRLAALEEAAKEVEAFGRAWGLSYVTMTNEIALAIRNLAKGQRGEHHKG